MEELGGGEQKRLARVPSMAESLKRPPEENRAVGVPSAQPEAYRRKTVILSMDGGGIRGLIAGRVLERLEQLLKAKTGDDTVVLADYFDLVAGTSTGGLLGIMLMAPGEDGRPLMNARECIDFYCRNGEFIFMNRWWHVFHGNIRQFWRPKYSAWRLEKLLKKYLIHSGRPLTMRDLLKPILITSFDIERATPFFFIHQNAIVNEDMDYTLWEICRGASAAPTYFPPAVIRSVSGKVTSTLIDGATVQNNPALVALTHALGNKDAYPDAHSLKDLLILSIGTGKLEETHTFKEARKWGLARWVRPLLNIMMEGNSDTIDYQVGAACAGQGCSDNYLRLQLQGLPDKTAFIDNATEKNVTQLLSLTDELLQKKATQRDILGQQVLMERTNEECLAAFADKLVLERRERNSVEREFERRMLEFADEAPPGAARSVFARMNDTQRQMVSPATKKFFGSEHGGTSGADHRSMSIKF